MRSARETTYLRVSSVSYVQGLATYLRSLRPAASFSLLAMLRDQPFLLPLLLVPAILILIWPRARGLEKEASALRVTAPGGRLFLLMPNAGLYYLVSGVRNPTPFDYPLVTAFALTGEADLAESIARGELREVCMAPMAGPLPPEPLQRTVLAYMSARADLGACTLYEHPSREPR